MWLNPAWSFRKGHIINPVIGAGQNYQKRIVLYYGAGPDGDENVYLDSKCKIDFGDIRFTDSTGITLLDYWIEKQVNSDYAICWVEVVADLSVYEKKIYIYYGNVAATSIANGDNTFIFFDDFENGLSKWFVVGKQEGPYTALANQHKIVQTSDGTLHVASVSCFSSGSGTSSIDIYSSRDSGITWEVLNVRIWTPGQLNFPSIAKDANDNLYITYGYMAGGADGNIRFKKATVNKSTPSLWTWTLGSEISVDATITDGGGPDIIVDSNGYIHVAYMRQLVNKSRWARSIDGGTTWIREEITLPTGGNQGYMLISIGLDSQNNLYFGIGPMFILSRNFKFFVEKIDYLGGTSWSQNVPVEVSSGVSSYGQLNILPDDRICVIYGIEDTTNVYFRKTTNPRDLSTWNAEVIASTSNEAQSSSFAFTDSSNLKIIALNPVNHSFQDILLTESSDGGVTWSVPVLLTDSPIPHRYPASLRITVGGEILFVWGDYADWESKYGNFWFLSSGFSESVLVYGSSPTIGADHAYSGERCVRFSPLTTSGIQKIQAPYDNKAVHVHFYDQFSPLLEYSVCSVDAGEAEVSYVGIINDIAQYEYKLQNTVYNSGVDRTVGWHEFITRSSGGLKQFIIDDALMPVTGIGTYNPVFFIFGVNVSEVYSYWDTVFMRKFVNPEPAHGEWGTEETSGVITYIAEDVENTISGPHQCDDAIYSLSQKQHLVEDVVTVPLSLSIHLPYLAEDILVSLIRQKLLTVADIMFLLTLSVHVPYLAEDIVLALLAQRAFLVAKEFPGAELIYPIVGGHHIIQIEGEE